MLAICCNRCKKFSAIPLAAEEREQWKGFYPAEKPTEQEWSGIPRGGYPLLLCPRCVAAFNLFMTEAGAKLE